jgi:hypothetical protein
MNINEISKPVTAASLNESLAKKFGQRIALERFTLEQLQDSRNKMRTKLSQVETNESFNNVQGEAYQKSKLFLDVLNAEITERELIGESTDDCDKTCPKSCPDCGGTGKAKTDEAAKPDFLDVDKDGDKEEPMKKAIKDKKKKPVGETVIREGEEDKAELVMASKDMVDKVTGWMEDTAEMQTESMLELADAIRDEHGSQVSEQFTATVKPALEAMYAAMETTRGALTQGVQMLTGEGDAPMMGADEPMPDMDMEPSMDMDMEAGATDLDSVDEFGAADAAAGGSDEAGRAKRESKKYNKQVIAEKSRKVASILSKKK